MSDLDKELARVELSRRRFIQGMALASAGLAVMGSGVAEIGRAHV